MSAFSPAHFAEHVASASFTYKLFQSMLMNPILFMAYPILFIPYDWSAP